MKIIVFNLKNLLYVYVIVMILWCPISAHAVQSQETSTPPPTVTPTPEPRRITLTLYRDTNSLTLYVPASDEQVNLQGLSFQVTTANGVQLTYAIERNYTAFLGMPFDNLPTPICFRLVQSGNNNPVPQVCQRNSLLLTQEIIAADVFWYDAAINQDRLILILQNGTSFSVCASGQVECSIDFLLFPSPRSTDMPTLLPQTSLNISTTSVVPGSSPTITVTSKPYLCVGQIVSRIPSSTMLNVIRSYPSGNAPRKSAIKQGTSIHILAQYEETNTKLWYQISDINGHTLGWILNEYVSLPMPCHS